MSVSWLWIAQKWSHPLLEHQKYHLSSVLNGSSSLLICVFQDKAAWKWYRWSSSYSSSEAAKPCGLSCLPNPCTPSLISSHFWIEQTHFPLLKQFPHILYWDSVFQHSFTLLQGSIRSSDHRNQSQCGWGWPRLAGHSSMTRGRDERNKEDRKAGVNTFNTQT